MACGRAHLGKSRPQGLQAMSTLEAATSAHTSSRDAFAHMPYRVRVKGFSNCEFRVWCRKSLVKTIRPGLLSRRRLRIQKCLSLALVSNIYAQRPQIRDSGVEPRGEVLEMEKQEAAKEGQQRLRGHRRLEIWEWLARLRWLLL